MRGRCGRKPASEEEQPEHTWCSSASFILWAEPFSKSVCHPHLSGLKGRLPFSTKKHAVVMRYQECRVLTIAASAIWALFVLLPMQNPNGRAVSPSLLDCLRAERSV